MVAGLKELELQLGGTIIDISIIASQSVDKYKVTLYYKALSLADEAK